MKKRILGLLLAVSLLLCMLPSAMAAQGPSFSLSSGSVEPGGSVTLTVSAENNPGIITAMLYFYYDTAVFTVDPAKDVTLATEQLGLGGLVANTIAAHKATGRYDGKVGKDGILVLWHSSNGADVTKNGPMFSVTLHAASDAAPGSYEIGLGYSPREIQNQSFEKLTPALSGGTVRVEGDTSQQRPEPEPPAATPEFPDIAGTWAERYIAMAAVQGLVIGDNTGLYRPASTMTRAEFVMILWRAQGSPKPRGKASFTDIPDPWYQDAIAWAEENEVVNGMGNGCFAPRGNVTRQQVVTILHRLCGRPKGMEVLFASTYDTLFPDSGKIHDWARDAVYWSLYREIYCGVGTPDPGTHLEPLADADRSQIAVMMVRYLEKYGKEGNSL